MAYSNRWLCVPAMLALAILLSATQVGRAAGDAGWTANDGQIGASPDGRVTSGNHDLVDVRLTNTTNRKVSVRVYCLNHTDPQRRTQPNDYALDPGDSVAPTFSVPRGANATLKILYRLRE